MSARPDHRQLPLLLDVPARVPDRLRHEARDAHAARLRAARSPAPRAASAPGTPTPSTRCITAPTAAAASRTARPHQPLPEAIVGARAGLAAAGLAPAAAVDVQARLERWGSVHGDPGPRPAQATGPVGLFVGDAVPAGETRGVDAALRLLARAGLEAVVVGAGRSTGLVASALGFVGHREDARGRGARRRRGVGLPPAARPRPRRSLRLRSRLRVAARRDLAGGRPRPRSDGRAGRGARQRHAAVPAAAGQRALGLSGAGPRRPRRRPAVARASSWPPRSAPDTSAGPLRRDERAHPCGTAGGLDLTQPALAAGLADARIEDAEIRGRRPAGHRGSGLRPLPAPARRPDGSKWSTSSNCCASRL